MRSNLAISALVVASFFGATAIASAQTDPAQPAPAASGKTSGAKVVTHQKIQLVQPTIMNYRNARASMDYRSRPGGRPISRTPRFMTFDETCGFCAGTVQKPL